MGNEDLQLINKMQQFLIENAKQVYKCYTTDCIDIFIHEKEDLPFLNYGIPTKSELTNFDDKYSEVVNVFNKNNRQIRFEFLDEYAPLLSSLLSSVGLKEESRLDFMICTKDSFTKIPSLDHFAVSVLDSTSAREKLKNFKFIQDSSFQKDVNIEIDSIDPDDVLSGIGKGVGLIGYYDKTPVSASQYTQIIDEVTEIVGVATLPQYRNNGFGSIIASAITELALKNGASIVCLTAADAKVSKIYSTIGFSKVATMLAYS